jgi:hypothetical protein
VELKPASDKKFNRLMAGNRMAILMMLFNEAYPLYNKATDNTINIENAYSAIEKLQQDSEQCGQMLLVFDKDIKQARSNEYETRVDRMAQYLDKAGEFANKPLLSLCSVLASNYNAPEGFVPIAAVLDYMMFQENIDLSDPTFIKYNKMIDDNFNTDNVIQSFFNAVVNYYSEEDDEGKLRKFSKYVSRMFRSVYQIKENSHRDCWMGMYSQLLEDQSILNLAEYKLPQIQKLAIMIDKIDSTAANKFFENGFKCVQKFTFNLI